MSDTDTVSICLANGFWRWSSRTATREKLKVDMHTGVHFSINIIKL